MKSVHRSFTGFDSSFFFPFCCFFFIFSFALFRKGLSSFSSSLFLKASLFSFLLLALLNCSAIWLSSSESMGLEETASKIARNIVAAIKILFIPDIKVVQSNFSKRERVRILSYLIWMLFSKFSCLFCCTIQFCGSFDTCWSC